MSFFSGNHGRRVPGTTIGSNPCDGIVERVCIDVFKVFDAAILQKQEPALRVQLDQNVPPGPVFPLTFISAHTASSKGVVTNLSVVRFPDRENFARVSGSILIAIEVEYIDAEGTPGKGFGTVYEPFDVVLFVPHEALVPVEVDATVSALAPLGTFVGNNEFVLDCCINIILKVGAPAEMLVPSYGYCLIPRAVEYNDDVCRGFFDLPLYPNGKTTKHNQ